MSEGRCTPASECLLTPYTDCCYTLSDCEECLQNSKCALCGQGPINSCVMKTPQGFNTTVPSGGCPPPLTRQVCEPDKIWNNPQFWTSLLLGFAICVAVSFTLISAGMLFYWLWTNQNKLAAEREIRKLNADKRDITRSLHEIETRLSNTNSRPGPSGSNDGGGGAISNDESYTTLAHILARRGKE